MYKQYRKYRNKKTEIDGRTFDSQKEARRYSELKLLEKSGQIIGLICQLEFVLIPAQYIDGKLVERKTTYIADFVYFDCERRCVVVEDVKGFKTPDYIIKRKLMLKEHGIRVVEI